MQKQSMQKFDEMESQGTALQRCKHRTCNIQLLQFLLLDGAAICGFWSAISLHVCANEATFACIEHNANLFRRIILYVWQALLVPSLTIWQRKSAGLHGQTHSFLFFFFNLIMPTLVPTTKHVCSISFCNAITLIQGLQINKISPNVVIITILYSSGLNFSDNLVALSEGNFSLVEMPILIDKRVQGDQEINSQFCRVFRSFMEYSRA